jgi:predicted ATPase
MLGDQITDPIQVMVVHHGHAANLVDVGYGVSQVLPIVVESLLTNSASTLLMQQPEVHLHPQAQAALGSLLVDVCAQKKKQLIIETHSDFIIDRVVQEVAWGKIDPSEVSILYFEKENGATITHPISLDELGNILDAPSSYRQSFLDEELNYLRKGRRKRPCA